MSKAEVGCCFLFVLFPVIYMYLSVKLSGSEHGELAGEAAGGLWNSHPLQVPSEVHPKGRPKGHGELLPPRMTVGTSIKDINY